MARAKGRICPKHASVDADLHKNWESTVNARERERARAGESESTREGEKKIAVSPDAFMDNMVES